MGYLLRVLTGTGCSTGRSPSESRKRRIESMKKRMTSISTS